MERTYTSGANKSPFDIRTFTYKPTKANVAGGIKWTPEDIDDQHSVGICTAISMTMRAQKFFGKKFSPDFQYLMQKKQDGNWEEGSSILSAIKVGKSTGFLPVEDFPLKEEDRKLPYQEYIKKLQSIPIEDVERMKNKASKYKVQAYASVPIERDYLANAIDNSGALLVRFNIGSEWWTPPVEPINAPRTIISGHAVNYPNYNGISFRLANSWGTAWADKGTAYHLLTNYRPTEAWSVWFSDIPKEIESQIDNRSAVVGKILDLLQQIIVLVTKLK